jgi:hypothetical protein
LTENLTLLQRTLKARVQAPNRDPQTQKERILQQMVTMGFSAPLAIAVGALSLLVHPCVGFSMSISSARLARLSSHSGIGISPMGGIRRIHAGQTAQVLSVIPTLRRRTPWQTSWC